MNDKIRKGNKWVETTNELLHNQRIENGMVHTRISHPDIAKNMFKKTKSNTTKNVSVPSRRLPWYKRLWLRLWLRLWPRRG